MVKRIIVGLSTLALLVASLSISSPASLALEPRSEELRAYWVDAFGEGIFTDAEIDELVAAAKAANMNAIVAQVGRRGDCFCNDAIMPRTQAAIAPLPYDPLRTLIDKAHAEGIEVHAWIIATAIWSDETSPPLDPDHVYNTHGPSQAGHENWITARYDDSIPGEAYLDPGHPAAADYIVSMYTSIVENYDVDGVNLDRIRYPDAQLADWPQDSGWGYNPVALDRFHAATGRSDRPLPDDPEWSQWRRDQVTNIVRRIYLESYAIKPHVRISADTITHGDGPDQVGGWEASRPYRETLQDWRGWLEEGILDLNIAMNYKREFCTGGPIPDCAGGASQRDWYEHWNEFAKDHQYGRHTAIGPALYLNSLPDSVSQLRKALADSAAGNRSHGWVGYSYRNPDTAANGGQRVGSESRVELERALTQPSEYDPITAPVFAAPAAVPAMSWKSQPTTGHIRGTAVGQAGLPLDGVDVTVHDLSGQTQIASGLTDGSGWFGFVDLAPGYYKVTVDDEEAGERHIRVVQVDAGELETVPVVARPCW